VIDTNICMADTLERRVPLLSNPPNNLPN